MGRGRHGHARRHARRRSRSGKALTALEHSHKERGERLAQWYALNSDLHNEARLTRGLVDAIAATAGYREPRGVCARVAEAFRVLFGRRATMDLVGVEDYREEVKHGEAPAERWAVAGGVA